MFASLIIERERLQSGFLPLCDSMWGWVQDVGVFAMVGLVIWLVVRMFHRSGAASGVRASRWLVAGVALGTAVAVLAYGVFLATTPRKSSRK